MRLYRGVIITARKLREALACQEQVDDFMEVFPGGRACLTEANLARAAAAGLNWEWLARFHPCREVYEAEVRPFREAYEAVDRPLRAAYATARQALWTAYETGAQPHRGVYDAARLAFWDAYVAATESHRKVYEAAARRLFLETLPEA